jgi:hypothetical protein
MKTILISQLKKINFKRNKKDPTIVDNDISNLNNIANSQLQELISSGESETTSMLEVKSALTERAIELSQMKDKYTSYSAKDTYSAFLDNLITIHLNVSNNLLK